MRGESHRCLGHYLVQRYINHVPGCCVRLFLIGCVQPDRNPVTYLKGSIRHQWLRGHNFRNSARYMRKLSQRLEGRQSLRFWDYYALGKLIHYTADAFTFAHNEYFPKDLEAHRKYEVELQDQFLNYLRKDPEVNIVLAKSIMQTILRYHEEYRSLEPHIHTDMTYTLTVCCSVLTFLFAN